MGGHVLIAFLVLGVLVFVHELGHFTVAKWSGVKVLRFSIGFGPRLLSWRAWRDRVRPQRHAARRLREDARRGCRGRGAGVGSRERASRSSRSRSALAIVVAGPVMNFCSPSSPSRSCSRSTAPGRRPTQPQIGGVRRAWRRRRPGFARGDRVRRDRRQADRHVGGAVADGPRERRQRRSRSRCARRRQRRARCRRPAGAAREEHLRRGDRQGVSDRHRARREIAPVSLVNAIGLGGYADVRLGEGDAAERREDGPGPVSARELGGPIVIAQAAGQQARARPRLPDPLPRRSSASTSAC